MVTRNLQLFNGQLQSKQPLFQIETVLSAPEIVLSPPANEIYKLIMQSVRDMVEGYVPINAVWGEWVGSTPSIKLIIC